MRMGQGGLTALALPLLIIGGVLVRRSAAPSGQLVLVLPRVRDGAVPNYNVLDQRRTRQTVSLRCVDPGDGPVKCNPAPGRSCARPN